MGAEIADLYTVLRSETAPFSRGLRTAAEEGESFTTRMGGLRQTMVKLGAATSLVGVGFAVYGVKAAGDFQQKMNLLVTACGESQAKLKQVSDGVLSLARSTGTGTSELADGMYQVEKAGYRAGDGLQVLKAAAQGAREEGASLKDVTNAMTSVMASYHLKASDSVRVMNGLKTAAGEGKMTMEEFSRSLSTVIPIASANKISFGQVAGAIATLTQHGTSAQEATQELSNTIRNLAAPNNVAITEMQKLGLSSVDVSTKLGKRGLTGTLDLLTQTVLGKMGKSGTILLNSFNTTKQAAKDADTMVRNMPPSLQKLAQSYAKGSISLGDWRQALKTLPPEQANLLGQYATLQNKTHGFQDALKKGGPAAQTYTDAIKKMTGGATGLNTTLQLTGENSAGFKDRVQKVSASFNDASKNVEGWESTQKTFNVQMARLKETVVTAAITIGLKLIPVILSVIGFFERHRAATYALAAAIGSVLAGSVLMFIGKALTPFVKALGIVGKGIGKLATLVGKIPWSSVGSGAGKAATGLKNFGSKLGEVAAKGGKAAWAGTIQGLKSMGAALKTAGLWAADFSKKMALSALQALRTATAWAVQKAQLVATTIAEKAAALAQWALNAAQDASPMVWIVLAIAALVAAIVLIATKTTWFQTAWKASWDAIKTAAQATWGFLKLMFAAFMQAVGAVVGFVKGHWPLLLAILTGPIGIAVLMIVKYWKNISSAFETAYHAVIGTAKLLVTWVSGLPGKILTALAGLGAKLYTWASSAFERAKSAAVTKAADITTWLAGLPAKMVAALGDLSKLLYDSGTKMIQGLVDGITSMGGKVKNAVGGVLKNARNLLPFSPAKEGPFSGSGWTLYSGQALIQGLADGITSKTATAVDSMRGVALATHRAFASEMEIASPSRKFATLGAYVMDGLISGLTGSTARVRAATEHIARALYVDFGSKHKGLQQAVARDDAALMKLARHRDSVVTRLKAAQKNLAGLQKAWLSEKNSVSSAIMQSASIITASPDEGRAVNSFDVVDQMRQKVAQATQFARNLAQLRKMGLRSDLIQQLATAGVDQAGATVQALAGGTKGQIQEMNRLQQGLKAAANSTGAAVADSMYGAGIKTAQGLVKGLRSQEAAIERQMLRIALAMQRAIKKALGIRSPSRVFVELGQFIPQGLARGIEAATHHATRAVQAMAGAVAGAGMPGGAALAGVGGITSRGGDLHVHVHVAGSVTSERNLVEAVRTGLLKGGLRNANVGLTPKR